MASRISYNVHTTTGGIQRAWSEQELAYFFDHIQRLQPTTLLFLDNREWALEAHRRLPQCRVILRRYYNRDGVDEGNMWAKHDAQWHIDTFAREAEGGLALNIWNEPVPGADHARTFAERYAAVMDAFGALNIPIVGPNFSVGFPNENWVNLLEPMWQAFDRWYNLHDYGIHEYGTHRGMLFFEPNHPFNVFPYRVGRQTDFCTVPYLISRGHVIPTMIYTEWGVDSAFDGTNYRGWRTCWDENRYAHEMIEADRKISLDRPYIRGYCIFSYGDTGRLHAADDWSTFNVMDAFGLHRHLEANAHAPVVFKPVLNPAVPIVETPTTPIVVTPIQNPTPPPVVVPPIAVIVPVQSWKSGTAKVKRGVYVNVRDIPSLSGKSVAKIYPNTAVLYANEPKDNWWHIKIGDQEGYAMADFFDPVPAPPDTYRFPFVLTIRAESQESANRLAEHLTARLVEEYQDLKDADSILAHMPDVTDFTVSLEG